MDENTLRIVASNLTNAYYSTNRNESEKIIDSVTKEAFLPSEIIIRTYRAFLSDLMMEEKEIQRQLTKLRES